MDGAVQGPLVAIKATTVAAASRCLRCRSVTVTSGLTNAVSQHPQGASMRLWLTSMCRQRGHSVGGGGGGGAHDQRRRLVTRPAPSDNQSSPATGQLSPARSGGRHAGGTRSAPGGDERGGRVRSRSPAAELHRRRHIKHPATVTDRNCATSYSAATRSAA